MDTEIKLVLPRNVKNSTYLHLNIIRWIVSLVTTSFLIIMKLTNLFNFTELFESRMNFQNFLESFSKGVVSPGWKNSNLSIFEKQTLFVQKTCAVEKSFFIRFKVKFFLEVPNVKKIGNLKGAMIWGRGIVVRSSHLSWRTCMYYVHRDVPRSVQRYVHAP